MAHHHGSNMSWRHQLTSLLVTAMGITLITASGCSSGGSDEVSGNTNNPPPPPAPPLAGSTTALATSVIDDVYIADEIRPDEFTEDAFGRPIQRTSIKIIFHDNTTVGEVNDLLIEFSAEIIATLAGYPAVVVRIPDPNTLQALETLVADIKSRGPVRSVIKSIMPRTTSLPPNLQQKIFNTGNPDPIFASEWNTIDHHLAIRGAAAWNVRSLIAQKPVVLLVDFFGAGTPVGDFFDIEPLPGRPDFGFTVVQRNPLCDMPPLDASLICDLPKDHGYGMLSIIAAKHSAAAKQNDVDFATGMVPGGIQVGVFDFKESTSLVKEIQFVQQLRDVAATSPGTVIVNLSLGRSCTGSTVLQRCTLVEELTDKVIDFIKVVRHIDVEDRALFIVAAGNRKLDSGQSMFIGPVDAATQSEWTASTLLDGWVDPSTQELVPSLTNVLVVENAEQGFSVTPPFDAGCVTESSFVGGHIAGIGKNIYMIGRPPINKTENIRGGGTSSATAQVSGVAAYIAALRPDLTPQQLISILTKTAKRLPNDGSTCTELTTTVPVVDAYAAVLATDPPGQIDPQSAQARLKLLDITDDALSDQPDGVFNVRDLQKWIIKLTLDPEFPDEGEINYGRYDLNGDGTTGGPNTDRFDLDISMDPNSSSSSPFFLVQFDFLNEIGVPNAITYSENLLTDIEIVCYYANTDLYELGGLEPFDADGRDKELEKVRTLCDPCAAILEPAPAGARVLGIAAAETEAAAQDIEPPICEEEPKIVFAGVASDDLNSRIYVINMDGSGLQRLTNGPFADQWPAWSPNRTKIAFSSFRTGASEIYVMDADGSDLQMLNTAQVGGIQPAWSPDGSKIAFLRITGASETGFVASEIYVMDADGSNPRILSPAGTIDISPTWSPDGTKIAFTSPSFPSGGTHIGVMNAADGSNRQNLSVNFDPSDVPMNIEPAWSPDGTMIVFGSTRSEESLRNIYVMNADGSNPRNLTAGTRRTGLEPSWSPDGTKIVFTTFTPSSTISVMDADGSNQQSVTGSDIFAQHPSW